MPDITIDHARRAKTKVSEMMRQFDYVVGVGLTKASGSYAVKVNLSRPLPPSPQLPPIVDGVPVVYEVVGQLKPRSRPY